MVELKRDQLGQFTSIDGFRAVIVGMTDALGDKATGVALTAAGRLYGKKLAVELGFKGATQSLEDATKQLRKVVGEEGSRLCIISHCSGGRHRQGLHLRNALRSGWLGRLPSQVYVYARSCLGSHDGTAQPEIKGGTYTISSPG